MRALSLSPRHTCGCGLRTGRGRCKGTDLTSCLPVGSLPTATCAQPNPEACIAGFGANAPEISISGFTVSPLRRGRPGLAPLHWCLSSGARPAFCTHYPDVLLQENAAVSSLNPTPYLLQENVDRLILMHAIASCGSRGVTNFTSNQTSHLIVKDQHATSEKIRYVLQQ